MLLQVEVKLDYWSRVPWRLCALAHWNPDTRLQAANDAVQTFSAHTNPAVFDAATRRWFCEPLRGDLELVATGAQLNTTSDLCQQEVAALMFVPVNEVSIESKHAHASKAVLAATNSGPTIVSLANRWPTCHRMIMQEVQEASMTTPSSGNAIKGLVASMQVARNPQQAASALGLLHHPLVALAIRKDVAEPEPSRWGGSRRNEHLSMALKTAMYRTDLMSTRDALKEAHDEERREKFRAVRLEQLALGNVMKKGPISYDIIKRRAMLDHFRCTADHSAVYEFPIKNGTSEQPAVVQILQAYFAGKVPLPNTATLFFKILKAQPSLQRQLPIAGGARKRILHEHIAVWLLERWDEGSETPIVSARASIAKMNQEAVGLLSGLELDESLKVWSVRRVMYAISAADVHNGNAEVLTSIACNHPISPTNNAAVAELLRRGVVRADSHGQLSLGTPGLQDLCPCFQLHDARPVFGRALDKTPTEKTTYELMCELEGRGFQWRQLPRNKKRRAQLNRFSVGSELVWYLVSHC